MFALLAKYISSNYIDAKENGDTLYVIYNSYLNYFKKFVLARFCESYSDLIPDNKTILIENIDCIEYIAKNENDIIDNLSEFDEEKMKLLIRSLSNNDVISLKKLLPYKQ
jgi:hypothetical protein